MVAVGTGSVVTVANRSFPSQALIFEKTSLKAMERVNCNGATVHFASPFAIDAVNSFNCNLIVLTDSSFPQEYGGILYSKSTPKSMRISSLPTMLAFRTIYEKYDRKYRPRKVDLACDEKSNSPLKFQQIKSSFYLITIGFFAGVIAFAFEFFISLVKRLKTGSADHRSRDLKQQ